MTQSHRDLSQVSLVAILHSSCDCNLFYFFRACPDRPRRTSFCKKRAAFAQNPIGSRAEPVCRPRSAQWLLRPVQWLLRSASVPPPYGVRFGEPLLDTQRNPVRRPTASDLANPRLILNATPFATLRHRFAALRRPPAVAHPCCTTHPIGYPRTPAPRDLHSFHK